MYYRLEKGTFCGFYETSNEDGTFIEISETDWNDILNKQSLGEVIFYNKKTKKLETVNLKNYEILENGEIVKDTEKLREIIFTQISNYKDRSIENGMKVNVNGQDLVLLTRQKDQTNIQGLVIAQIPKVPFKFKNDVMEDILVEITLLQVKTIFRKGIQFVSENINAETVLREKIKNMNLQDLETFEVEKEYEAVLHRETIKL